MHNRESALQPELKPRAEKPRLRLIKGKGEESLIDRSEELAELRRKEAEEGGRVEQVRQQISNSDLSQARVAVANAESLLLSDNVTEEALEETEKNLRRGLDTSETLQMELQGSPDSKFKRETMEKNRQLIAKIENLLEISGLDPENAKHEFLRSGMAKTEKENWKQLSERQIRLKSELSALNLKVDALEKKIQKSGIYGKGVSADELTSPAAGFMSRLKTGLIDTWRKATGKEALLSELRKLHAEQNAVAEKLQFSEAVTPVTVSEEETTIRRNRMKARRDRIAAKEVYGEAKEKPAEEAEWEYYKKQEGLIELPEELRAKTLKNKKAEDESYVMPEDQRLKALAKLKKEEKLAEIEISEEDKKRMLKQMEAEEQARIKKQIKPPVKILREHELADKKLSLMTIDAAKSLVPEASDIWNLAAKNFEKFPLAATKTQGQEQFGVSHIENHPATLYVYTIARYKKALREMDDELADEYLAQINKLTKALHLENNALVKSALARKPETKDVLKGTRQRRETVNKQTARWKY